VPAAVRVQTDFSARGLWCTIRVVDVGRCWKCASADRVAGIGEERDARGLEEPANSCVVAMTEGVEIRKPDPVVLDPMAVK
jgi:hypothetical protein